MELYNPVFIKRSLNIPAMTNLINANYLRLLDANSYRQGIGWYVNIDKERCERYWVYLTHSWELIKGMAKLSNTCKHFNIIWAGNPQANRQSALCASLGLFSISHADLCRNSMEQKQKSNFLSLSNSLTCI